jgi:cyclic beta-1,2-glucan synthetase
LTLGRPAAIFRRELGPDRGTTKISAGTDTATEIAAQRGPQQASLVAAAVGAALLAAAIYASLAAREWMIAGLAGAAGLALLRQAFLGALPITPVIVDAVAFALFAYQRNDSLAFWQLAGSWADSLRLDVADATVAYCLYLGGALAALFGSARPLRPIEALGLVATPFLFKLVVLLGADWHMAEIGGLAFAFASFPVKVLVGRTAVLFVLCEAALQLLSLIGVGRAARRPALHGLVFALSAFAALTPLLANFAQVGASPIGRIIFGSLFAALAEAGLWGVVYFMTGLVLDSLSGRPPSLVSARANLRGGATRGAIYGGVFMLLILAVSTPLRAGGFVAFILGHSQFVAPLAGAIAFPLAQTLIGSADGTPPFVGRLRAAYGDARAWARGAVVGGGCWWAYAGDLVHAEPLSRFSCAFVIGAFAYAGVDALFDAGRIVDGQRRRMQSARVYWLGVLLGGFVAGALGWYFDAAQVAVVWNKFWAYSDANYRVTGRALGDFVTYPIFNKYGMINLGEVAGGVRLLYAESLSGVINWSFAAPLFAINVVFLSAILDRSLRPIRGLLSGAGAQGLVEGAVRVMRWGLWMAPIINTFLRQSADPSWYNQDGAVRSLVAIGADVGMPHAGFADFSLTMFIGLLAYDWLRVLIWFDHMGLRVATLVNLSFLGADRLDERAARFIGHRARTRAVPEAIRRFGTWAPLLIPFYIPRGAAWDKAWTGAEALSHGGPMPGAVKTLVVAYGVAGAAAGAAALALAARSREAAGTGRPVPPPPGAPAALVGRPQVFSGQNGSVGFELLRDGRGAAYVAGDERGGFPIDLFRRPLDPLQQRGHFFYVCENGDAPWSIGWAPARRAGDYAVERIGFNHFRIANTVNGVRATMELGPDPEGATLSWRVRLENRSGRPRALRLVSFCEIAGHEVGAYARDLDFAGMHVETMFVRGLNAILARNRLLRSARADRGETSFFAVNPGAGFRLTGYEDSRTRFLGEGSLARPTGCEQWRARKIDDEGKLWTFDPAASFTLEVELPDRGEAEAEFIVGRSDNAVWAAERVAERLGLPKLKPIELERRLYETRAVEPSPALPDRWPFAFSPDGKSLLMTHRTPRPWALAMANELGAATVVNNDGEIYSAFGNSRHNGLTPFRFESATTTLPGQIVYVRDLDAGETDAIGFAPFQRSDAEYAVTYEPGVARLAKRRGDLETTCDVFVPPDFPGDMRLVALRNLGRRRLRLRVAPFFDIALDEGPNESLGKLKAETVGSTLLFENPRNDFQRGVAFAATSLDKPATENVRARFFGGPERDVHTPVFVEAGRADGSQRDDGRRVAAFAAEIELAPGAELKFAIVLGQARDRTAALAAAAAADVETVERELAATRAAWTDRLGEVEVKTNRPDFDRLVNTWLPYQLYASRLFGRVGPNQRGGAVGFRDQLQDVLPLILTEPRLARAQIVLHAGQQFPEGDVLKWWHRAPGGGTGVAQRTRASDPHLWLPYVLARYVGQSGDAGVLDEVTPYLEAPAVPKGQDTALVMPRPSRDKGDVYEHARRAIEYTLARRGVNGLPLLEAGDWNDGIDGLGAKGRGTSVWMGFFLYNVLDGFIPLARLKGDEAFVETCATAREDVRVALGGAWWGDHYALDFADDGRVVEVANAMTTGWAAYSGALEFERALIALEGGLSAIERPDRVLLTAAPFFEHSQPYPGRIADYPPGVRENGGQYSHGATWIVDGFLKLAQEARDHGDDRAARTLSARAFEIFEKISPLGKTDPERIATYGLIPIQQPADIYDGYGHGGRGGWSWYTGSAARMMSAAYALLGLSMANGQISVADHLFEPKGGLVVESLRVGEKTWRRAGGR